MSLVLLWSYFSILQLLLRQPQRRKIHILVSCRKIVNLKIMFILYEVQLVWDQIFGKLILTFWNTWSLLKTIHSSLLTLLTLSGRLLDFCGLGKLNLGNHSATLGAQAAVMDECHLKVAKVERHSVLILLQYVWNIHFNMVTDYFVKIVLYYCTTDILQSCIIQGIAHQFVILNCNTEKLLICKRQFSL